MRSKQRASFFFLCTVHRARRKKEGASFLTNTNLDLRKPISDCLFDNQNRDSQLETPCKTDRPGVAGRGLGPVHIFFSFLMKPIDPAAPDKTSTGDSAVQVSFTITVKHRWKVWKATDSTASINMVNVDSPRVPVKLDLWTRKQFLHSYSLDHLFYFCMGVLYHLLPSLLHIWTFEKGVLCTAFLAVHNTPLIEAVHSCVMCK